MEIIHTAQTQAKLNVGIHSSNQQPVVSVSGNTFPIKNTLKNLGFKWYRDQKVWWQYKSQFDASQQRNIQTLNKLGVDTSSVSSQTPTVATEAPTAVPAASPIPEARVEAPVNKIKTDLATGDTYNTAFPVNPKIYEMDIEVVHNDQSLTLHVVWGRKRDDKYRKTLPKYDITIFLDGVELRNRTMNPPEGGKWTKRGPTYDEAELVENYNAKIPELANNPKAHVYQAIAYELEAKKHEPEFEAFLEELDKVFSRDEKPEIFPPRQIQITEPGYEGIYQIVIIPRYFKRLRRFEIEFYTKIDHKLAPRAEQIGEVKVPVKFHTLAEVNNFIDRVVANSIEPMQKNYVEYLKSFAFTETQQEESFEQLKPIADMIQSGSVDTGFIKNELMKRQFIRPSRRQKRTGPGMVPADSFSLIIDDKAIRDATFTSGSSANSPEYFYTAIAYNLMRIKHNNIGFMPIFLDDAYRRVADIMKRYFDPNIKTTQVAGYINKAAEAVYTDLTGKQYRSWQDVYSDFYSGRGSGGGESRSRATRSYGSPVDAFATFVGSLNLGSSTEEAKTTPKGVYRKMAIQLHPDSTMMEDKDKAAQLFGELSALYNNLPNEMKIASFGNWYFNLK